MGVCGCVSVRVFAGHLCRLLLNDSGRCGRRCTFRTVAEERIERRLRMGATAVARCRRCRRRRRCGRNNVIVVDERLGGRRAGRR